VESTDGAIHPAPLPAANHRNAIKSDQSQASPIPIKEAQVKGLKLRIKFDIIPVDYWN
jgi:hypothetical protein